MLFAILPESFDTSRVVLLLIKNREFKKRSAIDWTKAILDWKVENRSGPMVQGIIFLELYLLTSNFF